MRFDILQFLVYVLWKGLAKEKAEWPKPGLVKFLKGEEKLRHASLKDFHEEI